MLLTIPTPLDDLLTQAENAKAEHMAYVNDPHGDLDEYTLGSLEAHREVTATELFDTLDAVLGVDVRRVLGVML